VAFFPTYLYFDKKGELVHRSGGRKPVADFIQDGKKALDPDKQLLTLERKYENGVEDKVTLRNYALAMIDAGYENSDVSEKYFTLLTPEEKVSKEAFNIITTHSAINSPSFTFLKENKTKFKDVESAEVDDIIRGKYYSKATELGKAKDLNGLSTIQQSVEKDLGKLEWKSIQIIYYRAAKDQRNQFKAAEELFNDPEFKDPYMLNAQAWDAFKAAGTTPEELANALKWSERSIKMQREYAFLDTYASLLYRAKKFDEAKKYANEAIAEAEKAGEDCKETKDLLKQIEAAQPKPAKY
jgi:hypothetical protein